MKYPVAERFKSLQGEGLYTGTPMAFIRLVGCSVGQKVCTSCDTDFDKLYEHLGGGLYTVDELNEWIGDYLHVCITGGEPLDRDLTPLIHGIFDRMQVVRIHFETSGTKDPQWFREMRTIYGSRIHVCVSPKPGYTQHMIDDADEVKVIHKGLGDGPGWPTLQNALDWARQGIRVYLQPRNLKKDPDEKATQEVIELVKRFPTLRASFQLHKIINER